MRETIKPIETFYNGYRFRSRLEARWAVFFDAAKIKYQYEPEGYQLDNDQYYLPDFYLPDFDTYVEVKRDAIEGRKEILDKCQNAIKWGGPIKRILVLSDVPEGRSVDGGIWHFPCLYWNNSSSAWGWWFFFDDSNEVRGRVSSSKYYPTLECERCRDSIGAASSIELEKNSAYILKPEYSQPFSQFSRRITEKYLIHQQENANRMTFNAFKAARQARFEYGETPKNKNLKKLRRNNT